MFKYKPILELFFETPSKEYNVREVARVVHIAPATASSYLKQLEKEEILIYRKVKQLDFYKANLDSDKYRDLKVYFLVRKLRESGFLNALNQFYLKPTIILFGSCMCGLDTEQSDLDLVLITEKKDPFPDQKKFEKKIGRSIQFFVIQKISDLKSNHLINSVLNGRVLQGEVQWM